MSEIDLTEAKREIKTPLGTKRICDLGVAGKFDHLPYSIRVLLEAVIRHFDDYVVTQDHVRALASYDAKEVGETEIPFKPGRVVLQDFTGVPAVVDLAAMRSGIVRMTGKPGAAQKVNPLVPCDLVIDHSVQVDEFAHSRASQINTEKEFERNGERYRFLKWGQQAFDNFRVVPPSTGIVHQVNLEYLAKVVWEEHDVLYPDSLVGTDSHTTMINGLGVLGWGVGGIEAEAVMLGQPIYMLIPEVIGVKLNGELCEGVTATDLVLYVTEMLREYGVVGKFVEFHGPGLAKMPLANRATIANMAPEYGATMGFFPVDEQTVKYMTLSGRPQELIGTVETYCKENGFWREDSDTIIYSADLELDLSDVEPSLSGPKRPQDRISLSQMQETWHDALEETFSKSEQAQRQRSGSKNGGVPVKLENERFDLKDGAVCIAAITSCTNTSNPEVMMAAGLVARKANQLGLKRKPWVKTSLAPGSKVVTEYYKDADLLSDLDAIGFHVVGYGCTTCIGNSGPLPTPISQAIAENELVVCSVLSGNRNFEGRIGPDIRANYLASPPLVVAYALAGTVNIDLQNDPISKTETGIDVYLRDIWPSQAEVEELVATTLDSRQFTSQYDSVFTGSREWQEVSAPSGEIYEWDDESTYVQEPPFFVDLSSHVDPISSISGARVLCKFGDSVTTDHISPAGTIATGTPAARYLDERDVPATLYNSLGSRRGNDQIMTRATFGNIRVKNQLAPGTEGGFTTDFSGCDTPKNATPLPNSAARQGIGGYPVRYIFDAVENYKTTDTPLVVLAGADYGMGSSRDWAAKGTFLLNVRAVIAKSFERIHRSNLVGMGVLPLCFSEFEGHEELGLEGTEYFEIPLNDDLKPRQTIEVSATHPETGKVSRFKTICRIDTPVEVDYFRNGGILHTVLRNMASE